MKEMETDIGYSVGVVLPAAGCGERMKLATPKQFCDVNGRPLICYTIDCFQRLPWIRSIVISTSKRHVEELRDLVSRYRFDKVTVVEGGSTRHRSIHAGVRALKQAAGEVEVAVIHDAVRPFVASDMLEQIVKAAYAHGAAGVCRPLVSTVIARDADQRLTESLDRGRYFNSEMPQAFQLPVILNAYSKCTSDDFEYGTECLLLAMKYSGVHAKILDGSADLWKVTYKKDLSAAEAVIKERFTKVAVIGGPVWPKLSLRITEQLESLQYQVIGHSHNRQDRRLTAESPNSANTFVILHNNGTTSEQDLDTPHPEVNSANKDLKIVSPDLNNGNSDLDIVNSAGGDTAVVTQKLNRGNSSVPSEHISHADAQVLHNAETVSHSAERTAKGDAGNKAAQTLKRTTSDVRTASLLSKLQSIQNQCLLSHSHSGLLDYSFVHVFMVSKEKEGSQVQELSSVLMQLSKDVRAKGILVCGVLAVGDVSAERISQMTASVIQRGHATFSGQLFLVC